MLTFSLVKIPIFVKRIKVLLTNIIFLFFICFRRNFTQNYGNVNHVLNNRLISKLNKTFLLFALVNKIDAQKTKGEECEILIEQQLEKRQSECFERHVRRSFTLPFPIHSRSLLSHLYEFNVCT